MTRDRVMGGRGRGARRSLRHPPSGRLTRLDLALKDVAHARLKLELLLRHSLDEGCVDCEREEREISLREERGRGAESSPGSEKRCVL